LDPGVANGTTTLDCQDASATDPGCVTTTQQVFGGIKTFNNFVSLNDNVDVWGYLYVDDGATVFGQLAVGGALSDGLSQGAPTQVLHGGTSVTWGAVSAADLSAGSCAAGTAVTALQGALTCGDVAFENEANTFTADQTIGTTNAGKALIINHTVGSNITGTAATVRQTNTSAPGGVGLGVSVDFNLENATEGARETTARISSVWSGVTTGFEDADLVIAVQQAGASIPSEIARFDAIDDRLEISGGLLIGSGGSGATAITRHMSANVLSPPGLDFDFSGSGVTCQGFTISVSGASTGDTCAVGTNIGLLGSDVVCSCYTTPGACIVRCCDVQGNNNNPAPQAVRCDVWKH
jgi:hypothetical protein